MNISGAEHPGELDPGRLTRELDQEGHPVDPMADDRES
jgi:hypothetical protein